MSAKTKETEAKTKKDVDVLGPTYEPGKPGEPIQWRQKLRSKDDIVKYLQSAERYWFGQGYGSEKRRTPA